MPISISQLPTILEANTRANAQPNEAMLQAAHDTREANLRKYLQQQENVTAGAKQKSINEANLATLNDPRLQDLVREGGSVKAGDLSVGGNPYMRMAMQGPHQAAQFLKTAQGAYKGISDQLDSAQATLDSLNQGNAASDKLALINEAHLAAGAGGSRAIKSIMDSLSGGKTSGMAFQEALNYVQNSPNVSTLQPAQRDAIRESVFGRLAQVGQLKNQADTQLLQQGPIVAPQTDATGIVRSFSEPAAQKLQGLQKMQQQYQSQRKTMEAGGVSPISQPSTANPNPTTLDRLKSFFSSGSSPQAQQAPATQQVNHADEVANELARRAKQALNQPQQASGAPNGQ